MPSMGPTPSESSSESSSTGSPQVISMHQTYSVVVLETRKGGRPRLAWEEQAWLRSTAAVLKPRSSAAGPVEQVLGQQRNEAKRIVRESVKPRMSLSLAAIPGCHCRVGPFSPPQPRTKGTAPNFGRAKTNDTADYFQSHPLPQRSSIRRLVRGGGICCSGSAIPAVAAGLEAVYLLLTEPAAVGAWFWRWRSRP